MLALIIVTTFIIMTLIAALIICYETHVYKDLFSDDGDGFSPIHFQHAKNQVTMRVGDKQHVLQPPASMSQLGADAMFGDSLQIDDNKEHVAVSVPGYGEGKRSNATGCVLIYALQTGALVSRILPPKDKPDIALFGKRIKWVTNNVEGQSQSLQIFDGDDNMYQVNL